MYDLKAIGERIARAKERLRKGEIVSTATPLPREDEKVNGKKPNGKNILSEVPEKSIELREKIATAKKTVAKKEQEYIEKKLKKVEEKKEEIAKKEETKKDRPKFFVPDDTPDRVGGFSPIQLSVIAYCFLNQSKTGVSVGTMITDLLSEEEKSYHAKRKVSDGPQRIIRNALRAPVKRGFLFRTEPGHYAFSKPKPGRDGKISTRDAEVGSFLVELKRHHLKNKF